MSETYPPHTHTVTFKKRDGDDAAFYVTLREPDSPLGRYLEENAGKRISFSIDPGEADWTLKAGTYEGVIEYPAYLVLNDE